jgi:HEAT repeat protein
VERVRALALIEQTQSEGLFKEDILRLLRDEAPAVRSAAVSLLATLPVTNPSYLLRHSLNDTDARVQANAVEVADTLHLRDLSPLIAGQMGAPDARLRANAVKFCAQEGLHEAGEQLIAMLESPAAAHRRSAIWVVERLQLLSLQPRIERLAATDRDAAVKKAALRVVQRFALGKRKDSPAVNRSPSAALGA